MNYRDLFVKYMHHLREQGATLHLPGSISAEEGYGEQMMVEDMHGFDELEIVSLWDIAKASKSPLNLTHPPD